MDEKEILTQATPIVREAGMKLMNLGAYLVEGRIGAALAEAQAGDQKFKEWQELDKARAKIQKALDNRDQAQRVIQVIGEIVGSTLLGLVMGVRK
jgi:hypothetical protein